MGVAGVVGGEPGGQLLVQGVGKVGDVAQGRGLAGALGVGVLLQAVLRYRAGERDGAVDDLLGGDEFVNHAPGVGLHAVDDLAEQAGASGYRVAPGVGEHAHVDGRHRDADRYLVEAERVAGVEVPVKRLLQGRPLDSVANLDAVADPAVLRWFADFAAARFQN